MVVITSCPGINVEILVDGQPLQEYDAVDVSPTPANTATKYIEARSDAEFAVRVTVDNDCLFPAADFAINMELDGKQLSGSLFHAKYFYRAQGLVVSSHSIQLSPKSSADQKICFTAFNIVDDCQHPNVERLRKKLKATGTISVRLQFVQNIRPSDPPEPDTKRPKNTTYKQVPESALRGEVKSHYASLSPPVHAKITWHDWNYIGNKPFAIVHFKYRSLTALRALHIIPREPTPLLLEELPEEDLSPEELRQVVRLLEERNAAAIKVKVEAGSKRNLSRSTEIAGDDEVLIVKGPSRKRRRGGNDEVIIVD